ncbi:DUF5018 domain-containing protein [Ichthyobacterium seriolicida]|uniref:Pkd domain containing protein n=1 Tax=Ichthyobacterium seriolicida TaxID=242600 RepID=A0A1J1E4Z4_9FLAO|nr:hypothetical protein [Ichthyobacterium seriolicida]BAV94382.1 hypothetical protein JBKA6_0369 [Ichthyobacterium seriolicida]
MKIFSLMKSIIFSFVLLSVFIFSCEKNKVYDNNLGIAAGVESISLIESENPEKGLGSDITCDIDTAEYTVSLTVPHSAILTGLKFDIKLSEGYSISPASGDEVDFELEESSEEEAATDEISEESAKKPSPQRYKKVFTVTKGDKSQEYTVYITKESAPKLTEFKISADTIKGIKTEISAVITDDTDTATGKILLKIPYTGTAINLTELAVAVTIPDNHTLDPVAGTISGDINGKEFTLKTILGSKRVYTVEAVKGPYISTFKFPASNSGVTTEVTGNIDHTAGTITVTVPNGVTLSSLTPTIEEGGNTQTDFTPSGQTDFDSNVEYTVTSSNPSVTDFTKVYTVSVTQNAEPQIQSFTFSDSSNTGKNIGNSVDVTINHNSGNNVGEIIVKVPHNVEIGDLTPTVTANTSALAGTQVYKGATGTDDANSSNNFTDSHNTPKEYSAVGPAGGRKVYNVKVYKEPAIKSFKFEQGQNSGVDGFPTSSPTEYDGSVSGDNISVLVANTVNVTNLKASITGDNINATNPIDITFTPTSDSASSYSATITVQNEHLSSFTKTYTVNLTKESAPQLTGFTITTDTSKGIAENSVTTTFEHPDSDGKGGKIKLKFPKNNEHEFNLAGLSYTSTASTVVALTPANEISEDITTGNSKITLTTTLGSTSEYTLTAVKGPYISSFKFETASSGINTGISSEISATSINHNTGAIAITVPGSVKKISSGENKVTLTPTIEFGGDATTIVSPNTRVSQEFTSGVAKSYKVTGADGMTKTYDVTVTRTPSAEAQITKFEIESGQSGSISETVSGATDNKGRIVVPVTAAVTKAPSIIQSDYAIVTPADAQAFIYDAPKEYTVRAEDNTATKTYEVYIYDSNNVIVPDSLKVANGSTEITPSSKVITENSRVITITVPTSTDLNNLILSLTDTSNLSIAPTDGQDFSAGKEVKYKLTETSGSVVGHYWVKVQTGS